MSENLHTETETSADNHEQASKGAAFRKALLIILTVTVIWLCYNTISNAPDNTAYMPNQDNQYTTIKTGYGSFPVSIASIKNTSDRTDLTLTIINPLNIHFADAKVSVHVFNTVETITTNLKPSVNSIKFKTAPIERGHLLKLSLELDKIFFK